MTTAIVAMLAVSDIVRLVLDGLQALRQPNCIWG